MLSPIDIQKREFKSSMNGYSKREVRDFMTLIAETLERKLTEIEELKAKLSKEEIELNKYKSIEDTLSETLVFAKQTSEEMIAQARKKEEVIIRDAEQQANEKIWMKQSEIVRLEKKLDDLNLRYDTFRAKIKNYLNLQLEMLETEAPEPETKLLGDENVAKLWKAPVIEEKPSLEDEEEELPSLENIASY